MAAGYSGTPLAKKLGIRDGSRVLLLGAPAAFESTLDGIDAAVTRRRGTGPYDVALLFAPDRRTLARGFAPLVHVLTSAGALWVCWPKKSSGVPTDLTENVVREHGLRAGSVDVKVAAIDETWSGLKFVRRLVDR